LIGLNTIKEKVREHAQYIKFIQLRKEKGFKENNQVNLHSVFTGNPGTGKTTVAKMMGRLYKVMGLLSRGHVHEVDRSHLVGEYIGQTAPKVKDAIEKARGGVLFIDEAYALARSTEDTKDFGKEAIEILIREISNGKGDMAVIVAGYPKEMKTFIDSNPGLRSRFNQYFDFPDYLPQELSEIALYASASKELSITPHAKKLIDDILRDGYRNRNQSFGNARFVFDLIEKAKVNLGLRVMAHKHPEKLSPKVLRTITVSDVKYLQPQKQSIQPSMSIDKLLLEESMKELNALIGMNEIKLQIHQLVDLVKFHLEIKNNVLSIFSFHTVFLGNPGTGKNTVARILSKIYKALGILEKGHMIETDRQGLVAGYVGQTAIKTTVKIDEAMGGVLFVDEAYSLSGFKSSQGDFGDEAIQTVLKRMEDDRGRFFLFVAGYPDNMETFLKANPGLSSRFDKILQFPDYNPAELLEIANKMIAENGLKASKPAMSYLESSFEKMYLQRDRFFGNARTVRKIIVEAIRLQNLRVASLPMEKRTPQILKTLHINDLKGVKLIEDSGIFNKKTIGFGN
jgi:SpoVK/Ycf46/Vps4 family AAA+-type ATPase